LGIAAAGLGPWMLVSGIRGWWFWGRPRESVAVAVTAGIVAVTLADWVVRIIFTR